MGLSRPHHVFKFGNKGLCLFGGKVEMEGLKGNQAVAVRLTCPIDRPEDTGPHLVHYPIRAKRSGRHRVIGVLKRQESTSTWVHRITRKCMFSQCCRPCLTMRFTLKYPREHDSALDTGLP